MSKELIVSVNGREKKIAIIEDDIVTEFYVERGDENQGIVGNIYKGRVMKVLPGMQSAFVDIGLERDSFLYVSDFVDEDEIDEAIADEKKETSRQQPAKQERGRAAREATRTETLPEAAEATDADDEKEFELRVTALKHIEEISQEPVIEPVDDDTTEQEEGLVDFENGAKVAEPSPRQRRQRRLRYSERKEEPEAAERLEETPASEAKQSDAEELPGRRRRRRRRSGSDPEAEPTVPERETPIEMYNGDEGGQTESDYTPIVIVHHEPLERITDDDIEATDGEMLKDALLQERIAERIHEDERRTSLLEVAPTPEVHVGSLHETIGRVAEFERISDDQESKGENPASDDANEFPYFHLEISEQSESGDAEAEEHGVESTAEGSEEMDLDDASAEIRQRQNRGEMATRRGGRGRRRGFRQRTSAAEATAEVEEANGSQLDEHEAPSPPPSPALARATDRFQRPVISDLLREGQEIIVQIAKEPIGQKGARITSHIALPGRYIVYMPTVEHIGVSRKIGTDEERQRLKRTLHQLRAETGVGGGFIVRTAANGCTTDELRQDMQYLIRTWNDIRRRSERIKAPAIVHRDLDLVQRILRDQLSSDFNAIRVDNEFEYERMVDFVNRFAPKLVNRVKLYTKDTPILEHYAVQQEIDKAVKPRVWLKSGGYIVINQTEALVAIDVNTGKFVGKSNRLEDTIVKTNLEAAKEIVRQIRLRDLGGIIVLDFIDMEERRNRQKVMQALEVELRSDRSPSKILQFNDFGLVAITRKRVKQSLERTLCTPCSYCGGGGMIKSAQTICYEIMAEARRVSSEVDSHNEVILRVNPEVAKTLRGTERDILAEIEAYLGGIVTIKSDPTVHQEQFDIAIA
ncbi:MAG: Rne/Rng family ribonuclease [Blastocatellia bacterium]|nr:Rne/Rng family ribonuclease [Blastocatellia bacterium]